MNKSEFLNNIKLKFQEFEINDLELKDNSLVIPVIDDDMPKYKIAVTFIDDEYLSIYACFKHNAVLKSEMVKLLQTINEFNNQSFLTFFVDKTFIKITYNMPELNNKDIEKVVRIISLIPNIIYEFYQDFKKFLS